MKPIDEKKLKSLLKSVSMDVRFCYDGRENSMRMGCAVNGDERNIKTLTDEELILFYQLVSCIQDATVKEQVARDMVPDVLKKMYNTPMAKA